MLQVTLNLDDENTKAHLKEAILELLQEKNELFYDALVETLEDIAFAQAIDEGISSENISRAEIFRILEGMA